MSFGQVQYDVTVAPTNITLNALDPVALPPAGEFTTLLAPFTTADFDDNGGSTAMIRYTGATPALVNLTATMSFERVPGSFSQHVFIGWNVGPAPLAFGTLSPNTRQETDLAFDEQDTIMHIDGAFVMNPNDVAQVWIRRVSVDPDEVMIFKVNGFMLTAVVADTGTVGGEGYGYNGFDQWNGAVWTLPKNFAAPAVVPNQLEAVLGDAQNFVQDVGIAGGRLKYTGADTKTFRVTIDFSAYRPAGPIDAIGHFYLGLNGVAINPTVQSQRFSIINFNNGLSLSALVTLSTNDVLSLMGTSDAPALGSGLQIKLAGYSLTVTEA